MNNEKFKKEIYTLAFGESAYKNELPYNPEEVAEQIEAYTCLLYTSPSPRDRQKSRMPSSA